MKKKPVLALLLWMLLISLLWFASSPLFAQWMPILSAGSGAAVDPTLQAWWKFNEGSGTTAADFTGNGNTGTLTGGASWTTGAVVLDGVDGYVAVANEANFDRERTDPF